MQNDAPMKGKGEWWWHDDAPANEWIGFSFLQPSPTTQNPKLLFFDSSWAAAAGAQQQTSSTHHGMVHTILNDNIIVTIHHKTRETLDQSPAIIPYDKDRHLRSWMSRSSWVWWSRLHLLGRRNFSSFSVQFLPTTFRVLKHVTATYIPKVWCESKES